MKLRVKRRRHHTEVYRTLDDLLTLVDPVPGRRRDWGFRYWIRIWKAWRSRHPGKPYVIKCYMCSGFPKQEIKNGTWKVSSRTVQRTRHLRDQLAEE
jgi:hypothetical protein